MDLINAQMVKLLAIQDNVAQMATYVAQISPFFAIPDNQSYTKFSRCWVRAVSSRF
jgi:hypothetical protein